jgi:hypothetical protein
MEDRAMSRYIPTHERGSLRATALFVLVTAFVLIFACGSVYARPPGQRAFSSPQEAVKAMVAAVKANDTRSLLRILGPGSKAIVLSGDPVEDTQGHSRFVSHYEEKSRLEEASDKATLFVGKDEWPFPIPIVKAHRGWKFDTASGKQEILARRVGRNELNAVNVCLAYVDAQKEYATKRGAQGEALLEYAQQFVSTPGKQDGLYWEAPEGGEQSPMGPLFAAARAKGYGAEPLGSAPTPYHGYVYKILKAQGKNARGGGIDYVVGGKMIGGFALVAYPAKYGSSGVMTFVVNQDGIVFQKDLGKNTQKAAGAIVEFDPDSSWAQARE